MIQTLRKRFIIVAMGSMFLVLTVLIGCINYSNYYHIITESDRLVQVICDNPDALTKPKEDHSGFDKDKRLPELSQQNQKPQKEKPSHQKLSPEFPFAARYFSVVISSDGQAVSAQVEHIAAITADQAKQLALSVFEKGKQKGFVDVYRFCSVKQENGYRYVFLNCETELSSFYTFFWISVGGGFFGLLVALLLVLFFSKIAMKPVAESYEKQKQFITDAGHELKTPLTIIDANTEVLEMMSGENEWTESIRNQVKRLTSLTGELVMLSRMEERSRTLTFTDFSLSETVAETAEPFVTVAKTNGKELLLAIDRNVTYHGDEASIRRLVSLLLDNAIKYASADSTINITVKANNKKRLITVENLVDTPPNENPERWFERFYRSDSSRNSATGGHGIGLSTAKAIVLAHKGKIHAKCLPNRLIQITVIL